MLLVEIVLVVLLAAFVVGGSRNGFIRTLGQLLGAIIGFLVARAWSPWLGGLLAFFMPGRPGIAQFIAFVIVFVVIDRLVGFLFGLADKIFKIVTRLPIISSIDGLLGAVLGFVEGVVLVGASTYLILSLRLDATLVGWLTGSTVARWCETAFFRVLGFLV
jgi:uncharacterized membrane protein required for colicin V production